MDIQELLTALDDPAVKAAIKAILKSHQDASAAEPDAAMDDATAEMEKDADVKPEDKKKEDDAKPALMRRFLPTIRALNRRSNALAVNETALLAKAEVASKAAATALLGKGGFIQQGAGATHTEDGETFIAAQLASGCKSRAAALMRMNKDKPELYATFRGFKN